MRESLHKALEDAVQAWRFVIGEEMKKRGVIPVEDEVEDEEEVVQQTGVDMSSMWSAERADMG